MVFGLNKALGHFIVFIDIHVQGDNLLDDSNSEQMKC